MCTHFGPLFWSVGLLAEGVDKLQFLRETLVHQSVPLQEGLPLKLARHHHHLEALTTPT